VESPAGYYKPKLSFSDNYYICSPGSYSLQGASACTDCSTASSYGMTFCPRPTSQPSGQPTGQPSRQPTGQPTGQPTRQPTRQPSSQPTSQPSTQPSRQPTIQPSSRPTSQPSLQPTAQPTVFCPAGTFSSHGACALAPAGLLLFHTIVHYFLAVYFLSGVLMTGYYVGSTRALSATTCSGSVHAGAAICQTTQGECQHLVRCEVTK
jgi:hypothetical protein